MMTGFDTIRLAVGKVDALAAAAEELFDNTLWDGQVDRQRIERCANLIGLTREAAEASIKAVDATNAAICDQAPIVSRATPSEWDEPAPASSPEAPRSEHIDNVIGVLDLFRAGSEELDSVVHYLLDGVNWALVDGAALRSAIRLIVTHSPAVEAKALSFLADQERESFAEIAADTSLTETDREVQRRDAREMRKPQD